MLTAEDLFEKLSDLAELKSLFCAAKPAVVIDSETGKCLWCNVAAAQQFGRGGLSDLIDQPLSFLQSALPQLKSLTGRLHYAGQQTLARLAVSGSSLGTLSTVSVKRVEAQSYTRPVLLRFMEGRDSQVEHAQISRFFFSYEDLKSRLFPSEETQTAFSFVGTRGTQGHGVAALHSEPEFDEAADDTLATPDLSHDEEHSFQAIADALGMRLNENITKPEEEQKAEADEPQAALGDEQDAPEPEMLDAEPATKAECDAPAADDMPPLENSYILDDLHQIEQNLQSDDDNEDHTIIAHSAVVNDGVHFIEDTTAIETTEEQQGSVEELGTTSENAAHSTENEDEYALEPHAEAPEQAAPEQAANVDEAIDAFVAALADDDDNVVALTWPLRNGKKNKVDKAQDKRNNNESKIVALAQKMQANFSDKSGSLPGKVAFQPVIVLIDGLAINANDSALKLFEVHTLDELNSFEGFKSFAASLPEQDKTLKLEVFNATGEPMRLSVSIKQLEADQQTAKLLHLSRLDISKENASLIEDLADENLEIIEKENADEISALIPELTDQAAFEDALGEENDQENEADVVYLASSAFDDLVADMEDYQADESSLDKLASLEEDLADLLNENEELERALFIAKQKEEELRAVVGTSSDGVLVLDEKGQILSMNAGAEALLAREELDVIGQHFSELLTIESQTTARHYFEGVSGYTVTSLLNHGREVKGLIGDGRNSSISLFLTIGRLGDQSCARYCAVFRDITPWKRTEAELQDARRRAEVANQQKSDFLAKISHEIRAPLNAIIGFSEVMLEERFGALNNQRYRSYLQDIRSGGSHIISLVNDLLDLAKIEAGRMQLDFKRVNVNEVLRAVQSLMQNQAHGARVIMRYSLSEDLPEIVADERSLKQVLINLVSNAIKFTNGGGQVILSTRLEEDGSLAIRVRDTGEGMDAEQLQIALQPFRQVSKKENVGGTGLGLPLSKALAEANHASFDIESEKNKGTTVSIIFAAQHVCANEKGKDKS